MKVFKISKRIWALLLVVVWLVYAAVNFAYNVPSLVSAFNRNWGLDNKLAGMIDAADGRIFYQDPLQNAGGSLRKMLGQETINGYRMVRGDDGRILYANFYPYEFHDYDEAAQRMQQLSLAAEAGGTSFLYLNCADAYDENSRAFDDLFVNDLNPRSDALIYALQGYGVDYLDARAVLGQSSLAADEKWYKTEPHVTIQGCFEIYDALVDKLNEEGGTIDPSGFYTNRKVFDSTVYENRYLGKMGRMAGGTYSGFDDFTLIEPAFDTDFTISYHRTDNKKPAQGDFSETLLDKHWLAGESPYENAMYSAYLNDVYTFRKIENNKNPQGAKVLMVADPSMLPVTAFLSTAVGEIHVLSPYSLPYGSDSLISYLADNDFDHVVIGLGPETLYGNGFAFLDGIALPEVS